MWKPPPWKGLGSAAAIRNARQACLVIAHQRRERDEVEAFLLAWAQRLERPLGA